MVHVRLPIALVAQLNRSLDRLGGQTERKINREMSARRALERFLAAHASDDGRGGKAEEVVLST